MTLVDPVFLNLTLLRSKSSEVYMSVKKYVKQNSK